MRLGIIGLREVEAQLETIIAANPEEGSLGVEAERATSGSETDRMAYFRAKAINSLIFQCAAVFSARAGEIARGSYASSLTDEIPSAAALKAIWDVSKEKLYRYKPVLEIEAAGFEIVSGLLEKLVEAALTRKDKRNQQLLELFPDLAIGDRAMGKEQSRYETLRLITDFVSGMTDSYAVSTFRRIRGMELPTMY